VFRSEVPPEQCCPDRDTRPGISGAGEARSYVPSCIQAFDRLAAHVQHPTVEIGDRGAFYRSGQRRAQASGAGPNDCNVDMGVALGYSGPIQIELIVQHNDAPSLYRDFLAERPQGGLHHVAFATARLDEAIAQGEALGTPVVRQWTDQLGVRYAYLEPTAASESYVELLEATPTLLGFFEQIEKAARFWDGDEPHRIVGE
jgi:hypothetical protein